MREMKNGLWNRTVPRQKGWLLVLVLLLAFSLSACSDKEAQKEGQDTAVTSTEQEDASGADAKSEKDLLAGEPMEDIKGCLTDFSTTNLDGVAVTNDCFKDHDYTIIDIWGTYCGPCIRSMPDLEKIHQEYDGKGIGVMGMVIDVQDENFVVKQGMVETAKDIEKDTGVTYDTVLIWEDALPLLEQIYAIPCYIIVDSDGNPVSGLLIGARTYEDWEEIVAALLQ